MTEVLLVIGFCLVLLPLSVALCSYAYHLPRATIVEAFNDRDLKAREAATDRTLQKLKALGVQAEASSTAFDFSNLN